MLNLWVRSDEMYYKLGSSKLRSLPGAGFSIAFSRSVSGLDSCVSLPSCPGPDTLIIVRAVGCRSQEESTVTSVGLSGIEAEGFQFILEGMVSLFWRSSNVLQSHRQQ